MDDRDVVSPAFDVTYASVSETGGRERNEDALGSNAFPGGSCFVVSDGAGGQRGGGIASQIVIESVLGEVGKAPELSPEVLVTAFDAAEARIAQRRAEDRALSHMSATVAALLIDGAGRRAVWGHLGDTRIMHFRRGALDTVTCDHSVVQRLVEAGYVSAEHAIDHPKRNLLYAALGEEGDTRPAIRQPVALMDGDAFLICTDGFWGSIDRETIEEALQYSNDARGWLESMRSVVARTVTGGSDNYTAIGIWIGSPSNVTLIKPAKHVHKDFGSAQS